VRTSNAVPSKGEAPGRHNFEERRSLMKKIEVFGTGCLLGCSSCKIPIEGVRRALAELGVEARVVRVDDIGEAQVRGVRRLPALVVDGMIKSEGKSLAAGEIKKLLQED